MHAVSSNIISGAQAIVLEAGSLLKQRFVEFDGRFATKPDGSFVTNVDLELEQFLVERLRALLPEAGIYAEEGGVRNFGPYSWVIDPIDGTTNFMRTIPHFCISVALTYEGQPILGMVYQPVLDELFIAQRGGGAFLNGDKLTVAAPEQDQATFLLIGLSYEQDGEFLQVAERMHSGRHDYIFRHFGAVALDQVYVAAGRADGVVFGKLGWWDVAAGALILAEAGAQVTTKAGNPVQEGYDSCIAAHPDLHAQLQRLVA